ncbi:hypothetical protein PRUPE_3G218800 [Prunus persica]|uniref:Late embryogenesis abundant protein LEA-2 subgroup domain-containing protein n=1 Tax=Prunus persica TaxID=3760 RepID=M5WY69_PRUPE|nr:uncharacterized protein LOC18782624 [Prunus persica]ONI18493.1 hypothetical protein PRUPE_3G218800 [Prunus persica]
MTTGKTPRRGLKICCGITAIFLVIVVIVLTTLSLTLLKPKDPKINAKPVGLENIQFSLFPNVTLNVTLGMLITIENRNYGSFMYKNSTAYVHYRNSVVAEVPIEGELVPARGKINTTTSVDLNAETLISNPNFIADVTSGSLNMTSTASLHGKVSLLKIFKFPATAFSTCNISFFILTKSIDSKCASKIKL